MLDTRGMPRRMVSTLLLVLIAFPLIAQPAADYGYARVSSDVSNTPFYIDGGYAGLLPLTDSLQLPVGKHLISFFDESVTSSVYQIERDARTDDILAAMGYVDPSYAAVSGSLARYDVKIIEAGSQWVYVQPDKTIDIYMDYSKIEEAEEQKRRYKTRVAVVLGVLTVVCIGALAIALSIDV